MKFYYENNMGDNGIFKENDLIKAIYTAWNIEACLYLINNDAKNLNINNIYSQSKLIFSPHDNNEFNSELLKEFGYHMTDGEEYREIRKIDTNEIVHYEWAEVQQLF